MKKIRYKIVFNRRGILKRDGTALLQIEAYLEGKRCYFSTGIYVKPSQWDAKRCMIKRHPNSSGLNMMVWNEINRMEALEIDLWRRGDAVTLETLSDLIRDNGNGQVRQDGLKEAKSQHLTELLRKHIGSACIRESTRKNKLSTVNLLDEFYPDISIAQFDEPTINRFRNWMAVRGLCVNTISKHLIHLRTEINAAIKEGEILPQENPFLRIKIRHEAYKSSFITVHELHLLESYREKARITDISANERHCLDSFLFCCYSGLRYSDFTNLTHDNFIKNGQECWIDFKSVKTGVRTRIPINLLFDGKALSILDTYAAHPDEFFRLPPNSSVDHILERIAHKAGLHKHISFHSARHTNATLLLYKGVSVTTVQKLLGHKNIRTTMRYCEVMDETILKDLKESR